MGQLPSILLYLVGGALLATVGNLVCAHCMLEGGVPAYYII